MCPSHVYSTSFKQFLGLKLGRNSAPEMKFELGTYNDSVLKNSRGLELFQKIMEVVIRNTVFCVLNADYSEITSTSLCVSLKPISWT